MAVEISPQVSSHERVGARICNPNGDHLSDVDRLFRNLTCARAILTRRLANAMGRRGAPGTHARRGRSRSRTKRWRLLLRQISRAKPKGSVSAGILILRKKREDGSSRPSDARARAGSRVGAKRGYDAEETGSRCCGEEGLDYSRSRKRSAVAGTVGTNVVTGSTALWRVRSAANGRNEEKNAA